MGMGVEIKEEERVKMIFVRKGISAAFGGRTFGLVISEVSREEQVIVKYRWR